MAEELYKVLGEDYHFIETEPMEDMRLTMGWGIDSTKLPYVVRYMENQDTSVDLIYDSDVVVFGGTDNEAYIYDRLLLNRPIIRISERLYKSGQWKAVSPRGLIRKYLDHTRFNKNKILLLCAGAYVASDFNIVKAYPGKKYKWGYFPEFRQYDMAELMQKKDEKGELEILWSGRFIGWKHPEAVIYVAKRLRDDGIKFRMRMIGGGKRESSIMRQVLEEKLGDSFIFDGYKTPDMVRYSMERADIYLFTSDNLEGWGAVLNESMNSGCAVVACTSAGSTPYLVEDGNNGYVFDKGDYETLYARVKELALDKELRQRMGMRAYETIEKTWNPKVAAEQILRLSHMLLGEEYAPDPTDGPGSKAE